VSTHLYHGQRLSREHVLEVAAHGFDRIELFATRTHLDYHNPGVVSDLQGWLGEAGLTLHSVHAPIGERYTGGRWGEPLNLASPDEGTRRHALEEAEQALYVGRRIPFSVLIVHLGVPKTPQSVAGENSRDAARRSVEALQRQADPLGVRLAVEVILNDLSTPGALVHFVETVADAAGLGICLDFGHAHIGGDLVDAVETVSEHVIATHVHDNRGRLDDHLPPFDGSIDWPGVLTAVQKVGYEGALIFEVAPQGGSKATLQKLREARRRMTALLAA
jgi:sugar phosphate isomerase/epimerase